MVRARQKRQNRMDFRGQSERLWAGSSAEYVRRSMALRKQKSAYVGMRKVDV